jgi:hypothetical protein
MPYVNKESRARLSDFVTSMDKLEIKSPGELNYLITLLAHRYLNQAPESYGTYNDAVGVLEAAKLELYRRHISQYENEKIKENGDV